MAATVGLLTIGEAPRPDGLARDMAQVLGNVRVVERGALDGLDTSGVVALAPGEGDDTLVTLRADGSSVRIAKRGILQRLQLRIEQLEGEDGADVVLLMCTGAFPPFRHERPLLVPQRALYATVGAYAAGGGRIGSLTPLAEQREAALRKWRDFGREDVAVRTADPYARDAVSQVERAANELREDGAKVLFMDCFGYDLGMKAAARKEFGGPVVLARSMAARMAMEVV